MNIIPTETSKGMCIMSIEAIQTTKFCVVQALPPGAQEYLEKQTILKDPQVLKYLESIGAVATEASPYAVLDNGSQQYLVQTNTDFFIRVNVVYTPGGHTKGGKKFTLEVHPPEVPQTYAKGLLYPASQKA